MFTGIIETVGVIQSISETGANKTFTIASSFSHLLKTDQSVAHDGVCLTVEKVDGAAHTVTAVAETLSKTTLSYWMPGTRVNLERCLELPARLDGHLVQGHVDTTGKCLLVEETNGSWTYSFEFPKEFAPLLVEKGSVSLNGISLTVFQVKETEFTVAIIPYTYEHTNMNQLTAASRVNIEFDIIGKYVQRNQQLLNNR